MDILDGSGLWSISSAQVLANSGLDIIDGSLLWPTSSGAFVPPIFPPGDTGGSGAAGTSWSGLQRRRRRSIIQDDNEWII